MSAARRSGVVSELRWLIASWQRPLDPVRVADVLRQWASDERSPQIVLEARLRSTGVEYLIGYSAPNSHAVATPLKALPNVTVRPLSDERQPIDTAGRLAASTRHRPLRLNDPESTVRAILAASVRLKDGEQLVLQLILGPRRVPLAVPNASPSSVVQPWWSVAWLGNGGQIDGEKRQALRTKVADFGFACSLRLGVAAGTGDRRRTLLLGLLAAIRVSEAPGLRLSFRKEPAHRLNRAAEPWRWPLRLGVPELVGLTAWPLGEDELPGQPAPHPKQLLPPPGTTGKTRVVADVAVPHRDATLALPVDRALHHLHVIGPTGVGKSTLLASLIQQDVEAGYSVVVLEPKGDTIDEVLSRLPEQHWNDAIVLDPNDSEPVGLNPLARHGRRPELVADNLLTLFRSLYGKNIGPRSADILYAALLTLAQRENASIVTLPLLLTNPGVRRSLTKDLHDPLVLEPFWATYESWTEAERANAVAPVMNKLRPLLRPGLRGVLGQREPRFQIADVFMQRKLLFVPLRRGIIGAEAASLLGSLVVAELWQAIQGRAAVAGSQRRPVMVYIDEAQNYLSLPVDLGDALAQARGYGVGFTLAHQFLGQFTPEMRAAVLANARSRIAFQLPHDDARIFERGHPELKAIDFETLGQYEVYASLFAHGRSQPYASGRTRPLGPVVADPAAIKRRSRERYGQPLDQVESGFGELLDRLDDDLGPTGRRPRRTS
jgi:hypothetical protein